MLELKNKTMRTTKFRGQRIDNGGWVYGFFFGNYDPHKEENVVCDAWIYEGLRNLSAAIQVKPETVGEYTGLKDKHGKEIYEGDVIQSEKNTWVIENKLGCFLMRFIKGDLQPSNGFILSYDFNLDAYEVIGNIYQNPELLK